ncbi:MAG TPA: aldo/keto reductase [Caulobacteraceae bacterium]|jgi:2,5-diketo-D-gluconate reductase A
MSQQPSVTLNDGARMPQFGLGVWQTPNDEAPDVIRAALGAGYQLVDTASVYGNEAGVGQGLNGAEGVYLTTKLWNDCQGFDRALKAFGESEKRLGRRIDLYLIHWPRPDLDRYVDTWRALIKLKEEGRVGSIGVSNFAPEHLERIIGETGVAPAVNQIELHPRFQQKDHVEAHKKHGIVTESWSPLGRGALLDDPVIGRVAQKHGKTPAQAIIRWHLDNGFVVIPKSANPGRIRQNIEVFDFRLDEDDLQAMAALDNPGGRTGPDPMTARF